MQNEELAAYKVFELDPSSSSRSRRSRSSENFLAIVVLVLFKVPTTDNFYMTVCCHGCRCLRMTKKKKSDRMI